MIECAARFNSVKNPPITEITMTTIAVHSVTASAASSGASWRRR